MAKDLTAANMERVREVLARLVTFDTQNPPGNELEAARFVTAELADMGCRADLVEYAPGRANAIGVFENGPGPVFAFNTHYDVVPVGDGWTTDPLTLTRRGDRLYGRGACDAKGSMAAMLEAMRMLIADRAGWSGTLIGAFVADEEIGSDGARHFAASGQHIDFCVIGEPTECTTYIAHKGSIRPVVRVGGVSAHSGMPDLGVNAITRSVPLLAAVVDMHEQVRQIQHPLVGCAALSVVHASGGKAFNVVPDRFDLVLDRRMVPGEQENAVLEDLHAMVANAARAAGTEMAIVDLKPTTGGPSETPANHPIVIAAQAACLRHNGRPTPLGGFQGGCDLVHLSRMGASGVVLGPGSLDLAHKPNEYVPVEDLTRACSIYRDIAIAMLSPNN
ncbi:M20 family metallopeptidase [Roseovarius mucosus]|uniref:M20 family metallopeptidase n=1 Tax=Roseovarius mucosus TaxID=215743 RepID=UPI003F70AA83